MAALPFTLSIEPVEGEVYQHGFHLGTDEKLARQLAEERFHALNRHGQPTRSVALKRGRKVVDTFTEEGWNSQLGWGD